MADATIICPHCQKSIELTEALAAPFIRRAQEEAREALKKGREDLENERQAVRSAEASLEATVRARVDLEKAALVASLRGSSRHPMSVHRL